MQQVQRAPWADFPDVILHTNATKLKAQPSYRAAKAGDPASAIEVADAIIRPEKIDVDFDVVVPVMQMDTGKHNAIPKAAAFILAIKLNRKALLTVYQTNEDPTPKQTQRPASWLNRVLLASSNQAFVSFSWMTLLPMAQQSLT